MIELATDLSLDAAEATTQTIGVLGAKRSGKSYLASKIVEGLYNAGAPFAVFDPVGNWSSLTLAADGKSPGLSVVVVGGDRADVPLDEENAHRIGTIIVLEGMQVVFDLSRLSKTRRKKYVADVCESIFMQASLTRAAFMVVFEEAQLLAPQHVRAGEERMLGAVTDIVRLGGNYGLGSMLITQRPQSVNKEVLNQVECLFVGQLRGAHERKALGDWIVEQGAAVGKEVLAELPSLSVGEFWCWSPSWLRVFKKVRISPKRTFDGSSTPKLGGERGVLRRSERAIDDHVKTLLAVSAPAKEESPGELDAEGAVELVLRLKELEKENGQLLQKMRETEQENSQLWQRVRELEQALQGVRATLFEATSVIDAAAPGLGLGPGRAVPTEPMPKLQTALVRLVETARRVVPKPVVEAAAEVGPAPWAGDGNARAKRPSKAPSAIRKGLGRPELGILGVLAYWGPAPVERRRLALLSGYSPGGGGFTNCLSRLSVAGLIERAGGIALTREGRAVAPEEPPIAWGQPLVDYWMARVKAPMRAILSELLRAGVPLSKAELGRRLGRRTDQGAFNNSLSSLRVLGLVEGKGKEPLRLVAVLAEAAREAA